MAGAVKGFKEVIAKIKEAREDVQGALAAAIYQKGMAIMRDAKVYCPVDTGRLRATGYVSPPRDINNPEIQIGFGTDYALAVHERIEIFHPVGQPLYLKRAVDEHSAGYAVWVAERARKNLKAGIKSTSKGDAGVESAKSSAETRGQKRHDKVMEKRGKK